MKWRGLLLLVGAVALVTASCAPPRQAQRWAEKAVAHQWQAKYTVTFHQPDEDLELTVTEDNGSTLVLDISGPGGNLWLEYGEEQLKLKLDGGELEWEDFPQQPPWYSLWALARVISESQVASSDGWLVIGQYRFTMEGDVPGLVRGGEEWTLQVEEFLWK